MSALSSYCVFAATILISACTLGANSITILAGVTKKSLDKPSHKFILGLAASDLMVGLVFPVHMIYKTFYEDHHVKDTFTKYLCHCFLPIFPVLVSCAVSNVLQMVIAFDRCFSIMKPVLHRNFLTKRIANCIVIAIFLLATFMSSIPIYWNNFPDNRISKSCVLLTFNLSYYNYIIVPVFVISLVCLIFIYVQVNIVAATKLKSNTKTMNMVAVILTCHAICWFPHMVCTFLLLKDALPKEEEQEYSNPELYSIYHWCLLLAMSSSLLNALLYSWRMPDFRVAINEIICNKKQASAADRNTSTNLNSLYLSA